jgi:radical SAM protein with 4Fe4S-binding SPASM domain
MQDNIAVELDRFCDKVCKHCGSYANLSKKNDDSAMHFDTVKRILGQVVWINANRHMRKIRKVHLTGGEPLMWQDNGHKVGDAVREIQKHGLEPQILTSGTIPSDKGFKRYVEGVESLRGPGFFNVYHSFNLYMAGANIVDRLKNTLPLFDEIFGEDRELGFFGVYDRSNRGATLKAFDGLMSGLGLKLSKSRSTRNWRKKSREGEGIELSYGNGKRMAEAEFSPVDICAGRARKFNLRPIRVNKECYILGDEGMQPVIGHQGNVYPCWAGPFPDTRSIGNIHEEDLSTILGREKAYLELFRGCVEADHDGRTDICKFCVDVSKDCLGYQFRGTTR